MSDTPQDPDAGVPEGGYGFPSLEQEVTPEVLHPGAQSGEGEPTPGELEEEPSAGEPTD
jgi:hypothetical protein